MYDRRPLFARAAFRILLWRCLSAVRWGALHRLPNLPFLMYLEPRFRSVGSLALFALGSRYEPGLHILPRLLRPGDVVFDCGANQGAYALSAATLVGPRGHVVAVEPQPYAVAALKRSSAANALGNITVVEAALSDAEGTLPFYFNKVAVAASLVDDGASDARDVQVCSVDSLIERQGLGRLDLMKLDVEGAEAEALRGASVTLRKHRPLVLFECWSPESDCSRDAWATLKAAEYLLFDIGGSGDVTPLETPVKSHGLLAVAAEQLDRLERVQGGLVDAAAYASFGSARQISERRKDSRSRTLVAISRFIFQVMGMITRATGPRRHIQALPNAAHVTWPAVADRASINPNTGGSRQRLLAQAVTGNQLDPHQCHPSLI